MRDPEQYSELMSYIPAGNLLVVAGVALVTVFIIGLLLGIRLRDWQNEHYDEPIDTGHGQGLDLDRRGHDPEAWFSEYRERRDRNLQVR